MRETQCERCSKVVDPEKAHKLSLGPAFWPVCMYTCQECMEKWGEKCAKCGEFFHPSEGHEVSIFSQEFDETEQERKSRELYSSKFLCAHCYHEVFPGRPVKDDLQENE